MDRDLKFFCMATIMGIILVGAVQNCGVPARAEPRTPVPSMEPKVVVPCGPDARMTRVREPLSIDPLPSTHMLLKPKFPQPVHLKLIGRMAQGIYKWKTSGETHSYFFCGKPYNGEEAKEQAMLAAFHVVRASWDPETGDTLINPWGIAGTAAKEGQFDVCAFGLHPRLMAYELKTKHGKPVLKRSRLSISHTRAEVIRAMNNPKMEARFSTYDLGVLQVLDTYYIGYLHTEQLKGSREDLLSWEGFYWQVRHHMLEQSRAYGTDRPWMYWPGHRSARYDASVTRYARRLGARSDEI